RIRSVLADTPAGLPGFRGDLGEVVARAEQGRRRARRASLGIVSLVLAGVALPLWMLLGLGGGGRGAVTATTPPSPAPSGSAVPPGWIRHGDDSGVSIEAPEGWAFNGDPVPALLSPTMLFAVGTGP